MVSLIFPSQLSVSEVFFGHKKKDYMVISATLTHHFDLKKDLILNDTSVLNSFINNMVTQAGGSYQEDPGYPKTKGEWLVYATAYRNSEEKQNFMAVSATVGASNKKLLVTGERSWEQTGMGGKEIIAPLPFETMPLFYQKAFGGEKHDRNRDGLGLNDGLLPFIEYPSQAIMSPSDRPDPAAFSPIDVTAPAYVKQMGTMDETWLKNVKPDFPDDMQWLFFQNAAEDQIIDGFFEPDQTFEFINMHPSEKQIVGALPNYIPRFFMVRKGSKTIEPINVNLDTLIFVPEAHSVQMIWRSVIEVDDPLGRDIFCIYGGYENADEKRPLEYYQEDYNWRSEEVLEESHYMGRIAVPLLPAGHISYRNRLMKDKDVFEGSSDSPDLDEQIEKNEERAKRNVNRMQKEQLSGQQTKDEIQKVRSSVQEGAQRDSEANKGSAVPVLNSSMMMERLDSTERRLDKKLAEVKKKIAQKDAKNKQSGIQYADQDEGDLIGGVVQEEMLASDLDYKDMVEKVEAVIPKYITDPVNMDYDFLVRKNQEIVQGYMEEYKKKTTLKGLMEQKEKLQIQLNVFDQKLDDAMKREEIDSLENIQPKIHVGSATNLELKNYALKAMKQVDAKIYEILNDGEKMPDDDAPLEPLFRPNDSPFVGKDQNGNDVMSQATDVAKNAPRSEFLGSKKRKDTIKQFFEGIDNSTDDNNIVLNKAIEASNLIGKEGQMQSQYCQTAHFYDEGSSPHQISLEEVRTKLLEDYQAGKPLLKNDYACLDLSGVDLSGADLSNCLFEQVNFTKANLNNCKLNGAVLVRCQFHDTNLKEAELSGANLSKSKFVNANLEKVRFDSQTVIDEALFQNCNMSSIFWDNQTVRDSVFENSLLLNSQFTNASFLFCSFHQIKACNSLIYLTSFLQCDIKGLDLSSAEAKRVAFTGSKLSGLDLKNATLNFSSFSALDVIDSDWTGVEFDSCSFCYSSLVNVLLEYANIETVVVQNGRLKNCSFKDTNLANANFRESVIENSDFTRANLMYADFTYAILRDLDFTESMLAGAEFAKSTVSKVDFSYADLKRTLFDGWRPSK